VHKNSAELKEQLLGLKDDIKRIAVYFMGSNELAEDVFQDVFLELTKKGCNFKEESSFKTYFFSITRNIAYKYIRELSKQRKFSQQENNAPDNNTNENTVLDKIALNNALGKMKSKYREPLLLKEMEGLSYQEISEILRINLGTVKFRISNAKKQLLELLNK
jgi:RNA polymerase sigma-70 factor (ECF subfamily)